MSDPPTSPDPAPAPSPPRTAHAFTSLVLGLFGVLLLAGAGLLHHWHTNPPAFMQLTPATHPASTNAPPAQNATNALQDLLKQKTSAPLQQEIASKLLSFSTGVAVLAGVIGAAGLIMGVLSLRLAGAERGKAWTGMMLSLVSILAWGLAGWNVVLNIRIKQKAIAQIGDEFANYTNIINNALNMADDLLPGVRAGQDTVIFENEWRGKLAPDLRVQPVNSPGDVLLSEQREIRPVLIAVLNTQSGLCRPLIDALNEIHRDIPSSDLLILVVSHRENPAALTAAVEAQGIRFLTGKAVNPLPPYKDALSPTVFAIDHEGVIRKALVGNDAAKTDDLRRIARNLRDAARR